MSLRIRRDELAHDVLSKFTILRSEFIIECNSLGLINARHAVNARAKFQA
jgi:hypothetical protein